MPSKNNKIQVGDLWQLKDAKESTGNNKIYIIVEIVKHPFFNDSVTLKRIDCMDGGSYNIDVKYLSLDYRKLA